MQLIHDWQLVLRRAWSVRLMFIAALFSGFEIALPFFENSLPIPTGVFAAASGLTTAAAFAMRLVAQNSMKED